MKNNLVTMAAVFVAILLFSLISPSPTSVVVAQTPRMPQVVSSESASEGMKTEEAKQLKEIAMSEEAEAVKAFKKAAETYRYLGALAFLHDKQLALVHYLKSVELDPTNPAAWRTVAELYTHLGEVEKASDATRKVAELEKETAGSSTQNMGHVFLLDFPASGKTRR